MVRQWEQLTAFFFPVSCVLLVLAVMTLLDGEWMWIVGVGFSLPKVDIESLPLCWYCGGGSAAASIARSMVTGAEADSVSNLNR